MNNAPSTLKRMTRKRISPQQAQTARWPEPSTEGWTVEQVERYNTFKGAIIAYLAGEKVRGIEARFSVCVSQIQEQLWRALQLDDQGEVLGFNALIPRLQTADVRRRKPLPKGKSPSAPACKGGVMHILRKEDLFNSLVDRVLKLGPGPHPARLLRTEVNDELLRTLRSRGYTDDQYPFNTREKMYTGLCRIIKSIQDGNMHANARANENETAAGNVDVSGGVRSRQPRPEPLEVVQADEHNLHGIGTVTITIDGVRKKIPTERPVGIAIVDCYSGAILGASVRLSSEANESSLIEAISSAVVPGYIVKLPNGETAPKFRASEFVPELEGAVWSVACLDNAKIHVGNKYQDTAARIGSMTCWGPPRSWSARPDIESVFARVVKSHFSQLPSTTGSGDAHTGRASPAEQAVLWDIEHTDLVRLWYQSLAEVTCNSTAGVLYQSPVDALKDRIHGASPILLRKLPPPTANNPEVGFFAERANVCQRSRTNLNMYVSYAQIGYTNGRLAKRRDLLDEEIVIHIGSNLRTVLAFELSGKPLGELKADGHWGATDHSAEVRRAVMRDKTLRLPSRGHEKSPIETLLENTSKKVLLQNSKRVQGGVVKAGLELARQMAATSTAYMLIESEPEPATLEISSTAAAASAIPKPAGDVRQDGMISSTTKAAQLARDIRRAMQAEKESDDGN